MKTQKIPKKPINVLKDMPLPLHFPYLYQQNLS